MWDFLGKANTSIHGLGENDTGKIEVDPSTYFNPLSPHDALKHHFTYLKTDLIFLLLRVFFNENFHETGLPIHGNFL